MLLHASSVVGVGFAGFFEEIERKCGSEWGINKKGGVSLGEYLNQLV